MALETHDVQCPYCGESIELDVEDLGQPQAMIEDCSVCCRPIQYHISPGEGGEPLEIVASRSE